MSFALNDGWHTLTLGRRFANAFHRRGSLSIFLSLALACVCFFGAPMAIHAAEPAQVEPSGEGSSTSTPKGQSEDAGKDKDPAKGDSKIEKEAKPTVAPEDRERGPRVLIEEGIARYEKDDFDGARKKFVAADVAKPESALIAFDLACAYHKKGDKDRAKEQYQRASMARNQELAASAHYNMGAIEADAARKLAGVKPESVAPDKRQEIIDGLLRAVGHYRNCLEARPRHKRARRNLELIRQWIKFYSERWRKHDREKRRKEMNLLQFLEFIMQTQTAINEETIELKEDLDAKAEPYFLLKQRQEDLSDEIPTLNLKLDEIEKQAKGQAPPAPGQPAAPPKKVSKEQIEQIEREMKQLKEWTSNSLEGMAESVRQLDAREGDSAIKAQKKALEPIQFIWEAIVPFKPLLAKALEAQTEITGQLQPEEAPADPSDSGDPTDPTNSNDPKGKPQPGLPTPGQGPLVTKKDPKENVGPDIPYKELTEKQKITARRTAYLVPKAKQMLESLKKAPQGAQPHPPSPGQGPQAGDKKKQQEQLKKALELAIEKAPKAYAFQQQAEGSLAAEKGMKAYPDAEAARKILDEIAKAMPQNKDQKKKDEKKDQKKKSDKKKDEKKKEKKKKKDQKKKDKQKKQGEKKKAEPKKKKMSPSQAQALLRRVREREKERRRKHEKIRRLLQSQEHVDRDW